MGNTEATRNSNAWSGPISVGETAICSMRGKRRGKRNPDIAIYQGETVGETPGNALGITREQGQQYGVLPCSRIEPTHSEEDISMARMIFVTLAGLFGVWIGWRYARWHKFHKGKWSDRPLPRRLDRMKDKRDNRE